MKRRGRASFHSSGADAPGGRTGLEDIRGRIAAAFPRDLSTIDLRSPEVRAGVDQKSDNCPGWERQCWRTCSSLPKRRRV